MLEDALPNNREISVSVLEALHEDAWRWARSLVADAATADDVLQQAYVMIISGSAQFAARSTLKTWLFDRYLKDNAKYSNWSFTENSLSKIAPRFWASAPEAHAPTTIGGKRHCKNFSVK